MIRKYRYPYAYLAAAVYPYRSVPWRKGPLSLSVYFQNVLSPQIQIVHHFVQAYSGLSEHKPVKTCFGGKKRFSNEAVPR